MFRALSFGAGVQSTALLLLSLNGELPPLDLVMFSDTGWEPKPVYEHCDAMEELCREKGVEFIRVSRGNIREDIDRATNGELKRIDNPPLFTRDENGKKGILLRKCSRHYKARPLDKALTQVKKERGLKHVEQWFGISTDEMERMRISQKKWITYQYPLCMTLRWSRTHCLNYLEQLGYTTPKSACCGCPYRSNYQWRWLRDNDPEGWQDAITVDRMIRDGLPGSTASASFLHRDGVPLEEADIDENDKQLDLFGMLNECEGLCGV